MEVGEGERRKIERNGEIDLEKMMRVKIQVENREVEGEMGEKMIEELKEGIEDKMYMIVQIG